MSLPKLNEAQKFDLVGNINAGNVDKSIVNDILEILGYGRAIKPNDVRK